MKTLDPPKNLYQAKRRLVKDELLIYELELLSNSKNMGAEALTMASRLLRTKYPKFAGRLLMLARQIFYNEKYAKP